ncbi:LPD7 domain-containing protein, partial [Escherichia coli]|nr:LPD7 domain-containing protein [Escherichia coli]
HPDLTKRVLEPYLGKFTPSPVVENYFDENDNYLGSNYPQEYVYDVRAHKRDIGASSARREERADAREALKARYNAYRAGWTRPEMDRDEIRARFYHVSGQFAWRRAQVRAEIRDPLLRKLAYNVLALERRQAMIALKETLREERKAFYARPENRRMGYWQWVEQQALNNDAAAISCLRGRFYMQKKMQQENRLSENAIVCAVADDIRPYEIEGYQTQITRDGRIQYCQDGEVKLQDTGDRIEIADPYSQDGQHIAGAMVLAEVKSGERMYFAGEPQFVNKACSIVPWFNEGSEKPLPLTDRAQRQMAGYDTAPASPQKDEPEIAWESLRWLMEGAPKNPVQEDVRQQQKHDYVHDDNYSSRYRRH